MSGLISFKLSCICKCLEVLTSASTAMNNDQHSEGGSEGKQLHTVQHTACSSKELVAAQSHCALCGKTSGFPSLRMAVLLKL